MNKSHKRGYKLGEPFGIGVYLHWTFWLLVGYFSLTSLVAGGLVGMLNGVALIIGVFGSVVLHELGHSLAARHYGIGTRDITLYPIGGVASLDSMPRNPMHEMVIALAGPAVNVAIALVLTVILSLGVSDALLQNLLVTNLLLIGFNLIPAFPMDGGRVLRAGLSMAMPRLKVTRLAVTVGRACAGIMAVVGLFSNPMLMFIAAFVWIAGGAERRMVEAEESGLGFAPPPAPPWSRPRRAFPEEDEREVVDPQIIPPSRSGLF